MFCASCGENIQENVQFCSQCGASIPTSTDSPDPSSQSEGNNDETTAIWNPNAAANWCLVFSPAFGSYIQAMNWRTLGENGRAKSAMGWFYFSLAMLVVYLVIALYSADEAKSGMPVQALGFLYLVIWYFAAGRGQAKYVKAKFGKEYPRRGWGKPLMIGVAAIIGYFIAAFLIGFFFALAGMMTV